MIRKDDTARYSSILFGQNIDHYKNDDQWRMENNYYGVYSPINDTEGSMVFIEARSGLEILHCLFTTQAEIIVMESNKFLISEIKNSLEKLNISAFEERVKFIYSLEELNQLNPKISFLRIDLNTLDKYTLLLNILEKFHIINLIGEVDQNKINILDLIEICQKKTFEFSWKPIGQDNLIKNTSSNYPFNISVVVPCYKVLPWVDRCVESLIGQSLDSIEIILVDDGSPDETGKRLDEWEKKHPEKIKVIHKPNGGCASARNIGLHSSTGEYVAFVDADDWVDTAMFEDLYGMAKLHAAEVSQCGYKEIFEDSGRIELYPSSWGAQGFDGTTGLVDDPKSFLNVKPTIWRRIYRKDFLTASKIEFAEHMKRFDDLPFQFEILAKTKRMTVIPDTYYYYRQEREGQDIAVTDNRLYVHFLIFDWLKEHVLSWSNSEIETYLARTEINTHLWALSKIEKKYYYTYLTKAAHQFYENRVHLGFLDILSISKHMGMKAQWFVLSGKVISYFPDVTIEEYL